MKLEKLLSGLALTTMLALPVVASAESAAKAPMFGDYQAKGFLSDYSKIPTTKDADGTYEYRDPSVDYSKYNKLLVDRIKIFSRMTANTRA